MYKDVLRSIDGIAVFPVISLIIFVLFFALLLVYVIKIDKGFVSEMENMPFTDKDTVKPTTNSTRL